MTDGLQPRRIFTYLAIIAIAVVFVLQFGPGSQGCSAPLTRPVTQSAAIVNGQEISLMQFRRTYANYLQSFQAQGSAIPESLARQLGLPKQVLDSLVNNELLAQAAEHHGVVASDAELREFIHKTPAFQVNGKFDYAHYQEFLRDYLRKTAPDFENEQRRQMSATKMLKVVESNAVVSDDEVHARYLKDGNKARVTLVRFLPAMYADKVATPKPAELASYQKAHAKEISDYFEGNKFLYQQPERVRARHILIKADKNAPAAKKAEARAKLEALRKDIVGGKDFAEVAKANSEDEGSKANGGDLGFNERSNWVPEFPAAAFALKPGEVSQPVESPFGWHLIKVEEKKAAEEKKLSDVQGDIALQLYKKEKAKDLARAEAEKTLAAAKSGKVLTTLFPPPKEPQEGAPAQSRFETESKPTALDTGDFSPNGENIPQLGPAPELVKQVFALTKPGVLDKVQPLGEGFVVANVAERKLPNDQDFQSQRETLRTEALKAKQVELREAFLQALKKSGNVKINDELVGQSTDVG